MDIFRYNAIIAGFFTGGSLAIRGGYKAARNGAIGCAVLLAVIEGVGIGFQRMLAGSTKLEVCFLSPPSFCDPPPLCPSSAIRTHEANHGEQLPPPPENHAVA